MLYFKVDSCEVCLEKISGLLVLEVCMFRYLLKGTKQCKNLPICTRVFKSTLIHIPEILEFEEVGIKHSSHSTGQDKKSLLQ